VSAVTVKVLLLRWRNSGLNPDPSKGLKSRPGHVKIQNRPSHTTSNSKQLLLFHTASHDIGIMQYHGFLKLLRIAGR